MDVQMTFHQIESTPALKQKIQAKAEKLQKYFNGPIQVKWVCDVEGNTHSSHAMVTSGKVVVNAQASSDDLYKTFDDVISKLEKQLLKQKEQNKDHIHHKHQNI